MDQKDDPNTPIKKIAKDPVNEKEAAPESVDHPTPDKAIGQPDKNFFADFSLDSKRPLLNKLLLIPLALILVVGAYLLKPTIESIFNPPKVETYSPVSQEPKSMNLELNNPDDQIFTNDKTLVISGKTSVKSSVVINVQYLNSESKDQNVGILANDQGDFLKSVDLQPGINELTIFAFDPQGNTKTETREVYYSDEKL